MKITELKPSDENLKKTFLEDTIGRTESVCCFVNFLSNIDGQMSIGIDGKWGTGKTFFVKQTKMVLDALNPQSQKYSLEGMEDIRKCFTQSTSMKTEELQPIVTAYYDAWEHDSDDDPILSLVYEIMRDNYNNELVTNKRNWSEIITSISDVLSKRNVSSLVKSLKGKDIFESTKDNIELEELLKQIFLSILPERGNRLVIFIDELDRCAPSYSVKLLERVKHFLSLDGVSFVFSINFSELQNAVKGYYGINFDACRYMDRFFDIRMELPPVDMNKYLSAYGLSGHRNMREEVCVEIMRQMNLEMREASKFLQMTRAAAFKYTDGDLYEKQRYFTHDDGTSNLICYCVIVPIAIGLKMTNSNEFDDFVSGRDSKWLEYILTSERLGDWVTSLLLDNNESYSKREGMILVSQNQKIKELYEAIFIKTYENGRDYETKIGKGVFDKDLKYSILKAIGFVSKYTDFSK